MAPIGRSVLGGEPELDNLGHGQVNPERDQVSEVTRALAVSRAKALAIELEAPEYLRRTVGERPLAPAVRERWSRAVWSVQEYRDRYAVDDPERALGSRPAAGPQRADYDVAARSVGSAIGRELAVERGVELRRERGVGLSL